MNHKNSDQELVSFLKRNRPNLPESAPDLELKILAAIEKNQEVKTESIYRKIIGSIVSRNRSIIPGFPQWAFPPAMVGMLIVFWSGYRLLVPVQLHADEKAHLEAFLVNNWEDVLHDSRVENMNDLSQTDWFNPPVSVDSEQQKTN
jgi:hypothetical protein